MCSKCVYAGQGVQSDDRATPQSLVCYERDIGAIPLGRWKKRMMPHMRCGTKGANKWLLCSSFLSPQSCPFFPFSGLFSTLRVTSLLCSCTFALPHMVRGQFQSGNEREREREREIVYDNSHMILGSLATLLFFLGEHVGTIGNNVEQTHI